MSPPRARVVRRAPTDATLAPLLSPRQDRPAYRRIVREELEARLAAERIEREARALAETIASEARAAAATEATRAHEEARRQGHAEAMAQWLARRQDEEARWRTDDDRVVSLAVVLAERLVGAQLTVDPSRIGSLAHGVMSEARGARRATIDAHPEDATALRQHLATAGMSAEIVDVRDDPGLARGALRLHTDVGTLDAQLAPRLERLAAALRDALA